MPSSGRGAAQPLKAERTSLRAARSGKATAVAARDHGRSLLRLDTLVKLRWLAVLGQASAVTIVSFGLGFTLPFGLCFLVIGLSAAFNLALRVRYPVSHRLTEREALAQLTHDTVQLAVLLALTGGLQNPFSLLLLAPVLISAAALQPLRTLLLGGLAILLATVLAFYHLPLPWSPTEPLALPPLYRGGLWLAIVMGVTFTGSYAWRVASDARELEGALAAAELVLAREQHLSQIDGLAAAAAHELGTPLGTITLVAKEMQREIGRLEPPRPHLAEDIALLRTEVDRCRDILRTLTSLQEDGGPLASLTLAHMLEELAGPQRPFGVPIHLETAGDGSDPVTARNAGVLYGLGNLVDNAVDFATTGVTLRGTWNAEEVVIEISDDGQGFADEVLMRAGEPYVTTRSTVRRSGRPRAWEEERWRNRDDGRSADNHASADAREEGLGLGLFLAKTLLERSGARVAFGNRNLPERGAVVRVRWPRAQFERGVA